MTKKVGADDRNAEIQENHERHCAPGKVIVLRPHARIHTQWHFEGVRQQLYRKITSHLKFGNKGMVHVS